MIIHLFTWAFIIASWSLPRNWFKDENKWRGTKIALAAIALGNAIGGLISLYK